MCPTHHDRHLGGSVEAKVTRATTHVISGGVRTMKVLEGIARGLWVVSPSFVLESLANEDWGDELAYEVRC